MVLDFALIGTDWTLFVLFVSYFSLFFKQNFEIEMIYHTPKKEYLIFKNRPGPKYHRSNRFSSCSIVSCHSCFCEENCTAAADEVYTIANHNNGVPNNLIWEQQSLTFSEKEDEILARNLREGNVSN